MAAAIYKFLDEPYSVLWDNKLKNYTVIFLL